jgi:hypothetical protein
LSSKEVRFLANLSRQSDASAHQFDAIGHHFDDNQKKKKYAFANVHRWCETKSLQCIGVTCQLTLLSARKDKEITKDNRSGSTILAISISSNFSICHTERTAQVAFLSAYDDHSTEVRTGRDRTVLLIATRFLLVSLTRPSFLLTFAHAQLRVPASKLTCTTIYAILSFFISACTLADAGFATDLLSVPSRLASSWLNWAPAAEYVSEIWILMDTDPNQGHEVEMESI